MTFVELPVETQLAVLALVAAVVDVAVTALIAYVPWLSFLEQYKEEWGQMLGVVVLQYLQNALPGSYPEVAVLAVQLLLAVIAAAGIFKKFLASRGARKLL